MTAPRRAPSPPAYRSNAERAYLVAYDVRDPKRLRRVFRLMKGYGRWLQLSVFLCRLDGGRRAQLASELESLVAVNEDHVLLIDLGPAEDVTLAVESLGRAFEAIERRAVIV